MRRWYVLLGCFIGMSVAIPAILMVPMGLFLKSVTAEFGWSRTEFSMIVSIASLANAIALPIAGYLVDRFGAPRIVAVGSVLGCCGYAALSLANSYSSFIAIIIFTVMMGNLAGYPTFMGLAQRWFDKRLGLALAITSTGLGAGVAAFSYIITKNIEQHGWREAFLTVGIIALVIGLANLIILVRDNRGPVPEAERRDGIIHVEDEGMSLYAALRTREFWLYTGSFTFIIFALVGCNFHLPSLLSDRGASTAQIATAVAIGAGGSLFGRLFTGVMLDRFSVYIVAGVFFLGQAIGFLLLLDGVRWVLPAAFLLGAVQGAEIDVMGYVISRRFGRLVFSRIFGTCFAITMVGSIAGPIWMATIFDRTGSYDLGLMLFPLFPVVAFVLLWLTRYSPQVFEGCDSSEKA
jgi:MFS family permease